MASVITPTMRWERLLYAEGHRTSGEISYQQYGITRATDGSNNVLAITTVGPRVELDQPSGNPRPSAVLDKNGYPAVAWVHAGTDKWEVRFLRAVGDPTVRANWKNAQGTNTDPEVLGTQAYASLTGTASLARMPAGAGQNEDALYLFWLESQTGHLWWSKATVQGTSYSAWSAPVDQGATYVGPWTLATAPDATNRAIVVAHHAADQGTRLSRVRAQQDTSWDALVGPPDPTPFLG